MPDKYFTLNEKNTSQNLTLANKWIRKRFIFNSMKNKELYIVILLQLVTQFLCYLISDIDLVLTIMNEARGDIFYQLCTFFKLTCFFNFFFICYYLYQIIRNQEYWLIIWVLICFYVIYEFCLVCFV